MYEKAFKWSCSDECKYHCMWITVEAFQKDGLDVPQFYGKVNTTGYLYVYKVCYETKKRP